MGTPITLDRRRWYRRKGFIESALLRPQDNKCCCLGLLALHIGYTEDEIRAKAYPRDLPLGDLMFPCLVEYNDEYKRRINSKLASEIASTNDDPKITDQERESKLKELFAKMGFDLTFENLTTFYD